jgi:hypothetical protein
MKISFKIVLNHKKKRFRKKLSTTLFIKIVKVQHIKKIKKTQSKPMSDFKWNIPYNILMA